MRSPLRIFQRWRAIRSHAPRRRQLQDELTAFFGRPITLRPASVKGGYDEIYQVQDERETFALARVNSEYRTQNDPIGPYAPAGPLEAAQRLDREWQAYSLLSSHGLAPRTLWRTSDAIVSERLKMERASSLLASGRADIWQILEKAFAAISVMHDCGITHLDLNPGNLLFDPQTGHLVLIDFEFGALEWVTPEQQRLYDYLRLVDACLKRRRGGTYLIADPPRVVHLLEQSIRNADRTADLKFAVQELSRLRTTLPIRQALGSLFPAFSTPDAPNDAA